MMDHVKELARKLLYSCGCTEETYEGVPVDTILADLNGGYPDGYEGIGNQELAEAIYAISTTDRGWAPMRKLEIEGDAAHCGYTDLYDHVQTVLEEALTSGEPFDSGWLSSKKEIGSWNMQRKLRNGKIVVSVHSEMDEGRDLVYVALPEGVEFTDEEYEQAQDLFSELWGTSEAKSSETVPGNSTLDDILKVVNRLANWNSAFLHDNFETMKGVVSNIIATRDSV